MRGILRFLFAASFGAIYGLLFAQKPGKKLRAELKKSESPLTTLFNEGKKVRKETQETLVNWAENCEELQQLLSTGKSQFNRFVDQTKDMAEGQKEKAVKKLEELAENAKKAAKDLKKSAEKTASEIKEEAEKSGQKFKNQLDKEVRKIAKKIEKK